MAREERITVVRIMDRLNIGGPAIHAVLTTKGLDPKRFRTVLVTGAVEPGEGDMAYLLREHGVTSVVSIPSLGRELRPMKDLVTLWKVIQVLRREQPQVVHTHKAKAGAIGRVAALLCRVPVRVHTFHGHVLAGYFGPLKSRVFCVVEQMLARATTVLVAPSAAVADELATQFRVASRKQFEVVPLGFDLAPFASCEAHRGELRRELGVSPSTLLVAIVGRMVPVKDHATFIAAAAALHARRPDVHFVFVGAGELLDEVRADLHNRGLAGCCHLLGWRQDMQRLYADLDVLALSSINEGTPVALIEALAAGVPVVATRVGGVADVLREGERGRLVPPGDPQALAQAIEAALGPQERPRAVGMRDSVVAEYGFSRLCEDLGRLYLRLLDKR